MSRVVLALGGNALLRRGESIQGGSQERNVDRASEVIAGVATDREIALVHGSGPQVGLLAMRAAADPSGRPEPLDVLSAEIEGTMGYMLQRSLRSRMPDRSVVTLLTQVVVDPEDPAFSNPTKPIGPTYDRVHAERLATANGWTMGPDGAGWRRLVSSPAPRRVLELDAIGHLLDNGHVVVCAGGGGLPVVEDAAGRLTGIEAVVDKDHAASLIALGVDADALVLLTDARAIYRDWPTAQDPIEEITVSELRALELPAGSMLPKATAAASFVEATGKFAVIGSMEEVGALMEGSAGTRVRPD